MVNHQKLEKEIVNVLSKEYGLGKCFRNNFVLFPKDKREVAPKDYKVFLYANYIGKKQVKQLEASWEGSYCGDLNIKMYREGAEVTTELKGKKHSFPILYKSL